jgi:hypothetical protein
MSPSATLPGKASLARATGVTQTLDHEDLFGVVRLDVECPRLAYPAVGALAAEVLEGEGPIPLALSHCSFLRAMNSSAVSMGPRKHPLS